MYTLTAGAKSPQRRAMLGYTADQGIYSRDLGGDDVWHAGVSRIEGSRFAAWFTLQWRLCADYECLKGQMQAGRARIKRTPCREGTMDATCRSVPQHLGTAVRVLWGCLSLGRRGVLALLFRLSGYRRTEASRKALRRECWMSLLL